MNVRATVKPKDELQRTAPAAPNGKAGTYKAQRNTDQKQEDDCSRIRVVKVKRRAIRLR